MTQPPRQVIRFSTFELALDSGELRKAGMRIALQEHSRRVLLRLLERPGALVTREELRASLWPSDTFVDFEHGLNTAIKRLRDALGDSADTPRFIETLPKRGYRFIAAIESDLQAASAREQAEGLRSPRFRWVPVGVGIALLVATVALIMVVLWVRPPASSESGMTHLNVVLTPAEQLLTGDPRERRRPSRTAIALSPDGRLLAFSGRRGDQRHLYLRPLDKGDAIEVKATEGAGSPFFSPDGAWIGFWADGKIKKVRADGGPVVDVCATLPATGDQPATSAASAEIMGASWGSDDTIIFALPFGGLWHVPARGGEPTPLTTLASGEISHRLPHVLPGERGVLFTVVRRAFFWDDASTDVRVDATGERKQLVMRAVDARYLESGHLVFARDGVLLAQPFDATRFEVSGSAVAVLDDVMHATGAVSSTLNTGAAQVSLSRTGTLAYARGGPYPALKRRLVWVDAQGRESPAGTANGAYLAPRLSPDGTRIAVMLHPSRDQDVWVHEPPEGPSVRMTFGGYNAFPIWTPDGTRLTISRALRSPPDLHWVASTGGQHEPEILEAAGLSRLVAEQSRIPADWTRDGNSLVFVQDFPDQPFDIWAIIREGTGWRATPLVRSRFSDQEPALSPDGRWLAYASDESGRPEVYVQPFPGGGTRHQVSNNGGREPLWARNGRTLYYLVPTPPAINTTVMAVAVTSGMRFTSGKPKPLFQTPYGGTTPVRGYDIATDGRFLMPLVEPVTMTAATHLEIIQNWSTDLLQRVPSRTRR
jgi:serine/threonine-protein kinase